MGGHGVGQALWLSGCSIISETSPSLHLPLSAGGGEHQSDPSPERNGPALGGRAVRHGRRLRDPGWEPGPPASAVSSPCLGPSDPTSSAAGYHQDRGLALCRSHLFLTQQMTPPTLPRPAPRPGRGRGNPDRFNRLCEEEPGRIILYRTFFSLEALGVSGFPQSSSVSKWFFQV